MEHGSVQVILPFPSAAFVKEFQSISSYKNPVSMERVEIHKMENTKKERQPDSRYSPKSCYR